MSGLDDEEALLVDAWLQAAFLASNDPLSAEAADRAQEAFVAYRAHLMKRFPTPAQRAACLRDAPLGAVPDRAGAR